MENQYASPSFLARPPRSVPILVRLRLLVGGFMNQFGWFFIGFGMIFVWVFALNTDPLALFDFRGKLETAKGKITETVKTSMSEGGSEHTEGTPIYLNRYQFEYEGKSFTGQSYSVGNRKKTNAQVTIEFPPGRPERSRIHGMRTAAFPVFALFVVIFPIIGSIFVLIGLITGMRSTKLLRIGEYATGKLVKKEPTGSQINNQPVYKMTFEFQTETGETRQAIAKTHQPEKLEDNDAEPLLYDPFYADRATLLDHLPGGPRIDVHGQITASGVGTTLLCLLIPLATLIGHGLVFFFLFLT